MERILEPEIMADKGEAEAYDQLVSDPQGEMLDTCFALSVLDAAPAHGVILDLGVGTARIPINIRRFSDRHTICALDISQSMLEIAAKNIETGEALDIHCVRADMKRLPFPDASVDMVVSHVAMHHLPEPTRMLKEAARVLKHEGAFLIRDLKRPPNRIALALYVQIFGGGGYNTIQKKLYRDSLMAGFTVHELRRMAEDAGLERFTVKKYFITHVGIERKAPGAKPGPKFEKKGGKEKLMQRLYRR